MAVGGVNIRLASEHDLAGIFDIYDEQVKHGTSTFETTPRSPAERLDWLHTHAPHRYPATVATQGSRVVGWASLSPWSPRPAYARTAENSVYVHKDYRRHGVGRLLLLDIIERARPLGIKVIVGRLVEGNDGSIKLHEMLGFKTIGVMKGVGEKFGRVLDVRLMDLHLE